MRNRNANGIKNEQCVKRKEGHHAHVLRENKGKSSRCRKKETRECVSYNNSKKTNLEYVPMRMCDQGKELNMQGRSNQEDQYSPSFHLRSLHD